MTASVNGAPICAGGASPLRVATGGNANWSSGVRSRRPPARANKRRDNVPDNPGEASLLRSSEDCSKNLIHIGHLFMTNPRASLRSDNCPISIGMSVRFELEQVSAFAGIRRLGIYEPDGWRSMRMRLVISNLRSKAPSKGRSWIYDRPSHNHSQGARA